MTVVIQQEIPNIATAEDLRLAVNQTLVHLDDLGAAHPMLAVELPTQAKGSWVVRPNGTMQTTYKVRPNVTWHDGRPLSARDFVFAWTVTRDPELPTTASPIVANLIERIDTPDASTLVIEWISTYPLADAIVESELGPLPTHILEPTYKEDKRGFDVLPFWTREFVGVGPYRVTEWEFGSHLVLQAYDHFYGGKPKIDTFTFRIINDPTAVLANLLAGSVDGAIPRSITFAQTKTAEQQFRAAGKRPVVLYQPVSWIDASVRVNDPRPRELQDVRIRRGLLHALDRQGMVDALWDSEASVAHMFMTETDVKWDWIKDVVTKYEYDPWRARELLREGGWQPGSDGVIINAAGERVLLPAWVTPGGTHTEALPIMADNWKAVGLTVDAFVVPRAAMTDNEFTASFTGIYMGGNPLNPFRDTQRKYQSSVCPGPENRWAGGSQNRGCYKNPEWDRLTGSLAVAIDPNQQRQLWRGIARIFSEELPALPIFFFLDTTIFRDGVSGAKGSTQPRTSATWQIAEWDIQ